MICAVRHTYASVLLMLGARLVSVPKLLGHSDPKITERRYGHLLPDFMKSEVHRLRFGIDRLAPASPAFAPADSAFGITSGGTKERGRNPSRFGRDPGLVTGGV